MPDPINSKNPLPSDIESPSKIEHIPDVGDEQRDPGTQSQSFSSLMQGKEPMAPNATPQVQPVSPFDLAQLGAKPIMTPSVNTLIDQTNLAQRTLGTVQTQLSYPDLKLKSSQKYLVKNKLTDVNTHLRAANAKMGIPPREAQEDMATKGQGPIAQYLGYVTDGMSQLEDAKKHLSTLSQQGSNISPAQYMLLQLKFNKAQQELDFTSAILAKSIEGFKTIMNVQI